MKKQMELKESVKNEGERKSRRERDFSRGRMILEVRKCRQFLYYSLYASQKLFKPQFLEF